jgi:hypothetical protein
VPGQASDNPGVRRLLLPLLIALALFLAGCGDDEEVTTTQTKSPPDAGKPPGVAGDASPGDVRVINGWAEALSEGDVKAAAGYFALPSTAENGPTLQIRTRDDARLFNISLPCGATLVRAESAGDFTTATFELKERPGPGVCGNGTGASAQTAFVIEDGKIVEWRRVATGGGQPAPGEAV